MQTISSEKSLILWSRNINGSNIFFEDELVLRPFYSELFKNLSAKLKNTNQVSFVKAFIAECDKACSSVKKMIVKAYPELASDPERVMLVANKFRGNAGEILAEKLAETGFFSKFVDAGTYATVDPDNEEFVDAEATRRGMKVGIQVKNYSAQGRVGSETFVKAAAQSATWIQRDKAYPEGKLAEYVGSPRQYIVSTVPVKDDRYFDRFKGVVVFVGPSDLDDMDIQGSRQLEDSRYDLFETIANEIDSFQGLNPAA